LRREATRSTPSSDELWAAAHERLRASRQNYLRNTNGRVNAEHWYEFTGEVSGELHADVSVLVKGSRSAGMERVVNAIRAPQPMRQEA
jgi:UDP-N-acetylmuramyl pentapeptide synthase